MVDIQMADNDLLGPEDPNSYPVHRTDDPDVWGLADVARGRTPSVPTTIYLVSGDSASGVVGLLFPDSDFLPKAGTSVGRTVHVTPLADDEFDADVVWDGAIPSSEFVNSEGVVVREHSRGLLLGDYAIRREFKVRNSHVGPAARARTKNVGRQSGDIAPQGELQCAA